MDLSLNHCRVLVLVGKQTSIGLIKGPYCIINVLSWAAIHIDRVALCSIVKDEKLLKD